MVNSDVTCPTCGWPVSRLETVRTPAGDRPVELGTCRPSCPMAWSREVGQDDTAWRLQTPVGG